jgi:hypothetical protein
MKPKARKTDNVQLGAELDALVAERVMGWKDVHPQAKQAGVYWGKKPDKAGRLRSARVPDYSTELSLAYEVEDRMKELGLFERYTKELSDITRAKGLPPPWASPDQRCRAALKTVKKRRRVRTTAR